MKWFLRIANIFICAISALCITMFAVSPAIDFNVQYEVQTTQLKEALKKTGYDEFDLDGTKIKISDLISDEKVNIPIAANLTLKELIDYSTKDENQVVEFVTNDLINELLSGIMNDESIVEFISSLAEKIAKEAAKFALKAALYENMGNPDNKTQEYLDKLGVDDAYLDEKIGAVFTELTKEDAKVSDVADTVVDIANEIIEKMNASSESTEVIPPLTPAQKEEIEKELKDKLGSVGLIDESGNIKDVDEAIFSFIADLIPSDEEPSSSIVLHHYAEPGTSTEEDKKQEAINKITGAITKAVNEELTKVLQVKYVVLVSRITLAVIAASMLLWALVLIFALVKCFSKKKPYIYMGPLFWILFPIFIVVQLVLGGIPLAVTYFLPTITTMLGSMMPIDNAIFTYLTVSLKSSFSVSLICALVLFIFGIVYAAVAHKVKKQYKREKKAAKLAA